VRTEEFIGQYRVLEDSLEQKYSQSPRTHTSVVMQYLADPESRPFRDQLDVCREVRNLIIHNVDETGLPVVEPSEGTLAMLRRIIEYIKKPPLALSFATPPEQLLRARLDDPALPLMREMEARGFSHIPVVEGPRMRGVFSAGAVFSWLAQQPRSILDEDTRVRVFKAFLAFSGQNTERYRFLDAGATYADVKLAFEERPERNRRLAAIFITDTGGRDGTLLGLITPWDILGRYVRREEETQ
jgi:CBS domain-containing protein